MSLSHPSRSFRKLLAFTVALLSPALGQAPDSKPEDNKSKLQLRFVCITSLAEEQKVVLASPDEKGVLIELGRVALRSGLITDWLPAKEGELHLARREKDTLKSIGHFQFPADTRRALVLLNANPEKRVYDVYLVDPEKAEFVKGSLLVFNFSPHTGLISLGAKEEKIETGKHLIAKPVPDDSGMYRMMASYLDAGGKTVPCYDRYVSGNPNSREMLFLLPDKTQGMRARSLPLFGDFE